MLDNSYHTLVNVVQMKLNIWKTESHTAELTRNMIQLAAPILGGLVATSGKSSFTTAERAVLVGEAVELIDALILHLEIENEAHDPRQEE